MCTITTFKHAPCPTCKGVVVGRRDKRFCCLKCKNEHHRVARSYVKSRFEFFVKGFERNLIVLDGILGPNDTKMAIHKDALFKRGFNDSLCSKIRRRNGVFWYELGNFLFRIKHDGTVLVERMTGFSEDMPVFFDRWTIDFPIEMKVNREWGGHISKNRHSKLSRWRE